MKKYLLCLAGFLLFIGACDAAFSEIKYPNIPPWVNNEEMTNNYEILCGLKFMGRSTRPVGNEGQYVAFFVVEQIEDKVTYPYENNRNPKSYQGRPGQSVRVPQYKIYKYPFKIMHPYTVRESRSRAINGTETWWDFNSDGRIDLYQENTAESCALWDRVIAPN